MKTYLDQLLGKGSPSSIELLLFRLVSCHWHLGVAVALKAQPVARKFKISSYKSEAILGTHPVSSRQIALGCPEAHDKALMIKL